MATTQGAAHARVADPAERSRRRPRELDGREGAGGGEQDGVAEQRPAAHRLRRHLPEAAAWRSPAVREADGDRHGERREQRGGGERSGKRGRGRDEQARGHQLHRRQQDRGWTREASRHPERHHRGGGPLAIPQLRDTREQEDDEEHTAESEIERVHHRLAARRRTGRRELRRVNGRAAITRELPLKQQPPAQQYEPGTQQPMGQHSQVFGQVPLIPQHRSTDGV